MNRGGEDLALDAQFGSERGCRLLLDAPGTTCILRYSGKGSTALRKTVMAKKERKLDLNNGTRCIGAKKLAPSREHSHADKKQCQ